MKVTHLALGLAGVALSVMSSSCGGTKMFLDSVVPQEQGLTPVKLTDEAQNAVVGNRQNIYTANWRASGIAKGKGLTWDTGNRLAVSPDGADLAYLSVVDKASNVMVKKTTAGSPSTQRTFRRAQNIWWGPDGRLYFNDNTGGTSTIGSTDARQGSLVKQITNNNDDWNPAITYDGSLIYFTRYDASGPSIWSINTKSGELTNCTRGYSSVPYGKNPMQILCTRNSQKGNSELWLINLEKGDETLLLSDTEKGFSDPAVSPDGRWILVVANSLSSITNKQNTDIYAVRSDGTQLTQITYHPEIDCSPAWSSDGKFIYFISSRANKDRKFAIWKIKNPLD